MNNIPLSVPSLKGNEWKYVKDCIDTEWVSSAGKYVNLFEAKIAEFVSSKYAIATMNGTAALHISLIIAGVMPGDEVIVPTLTFIAPVNVIRYCSAEPVFMDCNEYYNIDIDKTIDFILRHTELTKNKKNKKEYVSVNTKSGRVIRAIIPVHVFGNAVKIDDLICICQERNIKIIEDATESLGTKYNTGKLKDKHSGLSGFCGCLSFNGNKIITTGGGGMIITDDEIVAKRAKYLTTQAKDDEIFYIHHEIGYNYRMTNIQAALGVAQIEKLNEYIEIKKKNYNYYNKLLVNSSLYSINPVPSYAENNYWMYALRMNRHPFQKGLREIIDHLSVNNIQVRPIWKLNHQQKPYLRNESYFIEKAQEMVLSSLNIPCSVNLTNTQIKKVIKILHEK